MDSERVTQLIRTRARLRVRQLSPARLVGVAQEQPGLGILGLVMYTLETATSVRVP